MYSGIEIIFSIINITMALKFYAYILILRFIACLI